MYDQIRSAGGLYIRPGMDEWAEWTEGVDVGKRRALGSTAISANTLDEWGDELSVPANRLIGILQKATTVGDRESAQMIEERSMHEYYEEHPELADINCATVEELQTIAGIGPKLSALIVSNQPFYAVNQGVFKVSELRGVGRVTIRRILKHYEVAEVTPF